VYEKMSIGTRIPLEESLTALDVAGRLIGFRQGIFRDGELHQNPYG